MNQPRNASELLADVRRLGVAADSKRLDALPVMAESAAACAQRLVTEGLLTGHQAEQLLAGRGTGLVLKQYVLLDLIGSGGMGQVYRARHRVLERIDAVKLMRGGQFADASAIARFRREARLAAMCNHQNLVPVFDADEVDGVPFIAMELVPGRDLQRRVIEGGPLEIAAACSFARQAALGLHHAHEQGLVHRDVKPANLLVANGRVRVTDLGLARAVEQSPVADDPLTASGHVLGTPDYIAPEQFTAGMAVDRRTDVYSLGATLYFMLAGRPPFPGGGPAEKLLRQRSERPKPLAEVRSGVPTDVADLVASMMAKEPAARPTSMKVVAERMAPFVDLNAVVPSSNDTAGGHHDDTGWSPSIPPPAFTVKMETTGRLPPQNRQLPRWWLATGIVLLLGTLIAGYLYWRRPASSWQPGIITAPAVTDFSLSWRMVAHKGQQGRAGYALAFSPTGDALVQVCGDLTNPQQAAAVRLWKVADGRIVGDEPTWEAEVPSNARSVAYAPDGSHFVVGCGDLEVDVAGEINVFGLSKKEPIATVHHARGALSLAYSPRGRYLISGGRDGELRAWDLLDPTKPAQAFATPANSGPIQVLRYSADGTTLASGGADGTVKLWTGDLWRSAERLPGTGGRKTRGLAFTNGSGTLVGGFETRDLDGKALLRYWDLASPQRNADDFAVRDQASCFIYNVVAAPDQKTLLYSELNPHEKGLVRLLQGRPPRTVGYLWSGGDDANSSYAKVYSIAVSPDGQRIATSGADANLTWWEPDPGISPPPPL